MQLPDERDPSGAPPSDELIRAIQAIHDGPANPLTGELGRLMISASTPEPVLVPQTPEADAAWRALRKEQLEAQRKAEGTYVTAIAGRLAENAMKLALVRAVSRNPSDPTIEGADVAWGSAVAKHCIETLLREADKHVAETEYEAKLNKAREIICKHGPMTEYEMVRRGFKIPERERADVLRTLVDAGMVIAVTTQSGAKGGRPAVRYSGTATAANAETPDEECGNHD